MKKAIILLPILVLANTGYAAETPQVGKFSEDLSKLVERLCLLPAQAGKVWKVNVEGKAGAKGIVRVIAADINGQATFEKSEWEGVQQVLKAHQQADNANSRDCVVKITPMLLPKFAPTPAAKGPKKIQGPVAKTPATASEKRDAPAITTGNITNSKVVNQNEVNGDVTIDMSH